MKQTSLLIVISLSLLLVLIGCQHQEQAASEPEEQSNETQETENQEPETTETEEQPSETTNETQETETQESETTETEEQSGTDSDSDMAALIETGQQLASSCVACHSIDGSEGVGSTWLGLYGSTKTLSDDSTIEADDAYLRESILDPGAKVVKGYQPAMPPYSFDEDQLNALIAYIQSLDE